MFALQRLLNSIKLHNDSPLQYEKIVIDIVSPSCDILFRQERRFSIKSCIHTYERDQAQTMSDRSKQQPSFEENNVLPVEHRRRASKRRRTLLIIFLLLFMLLGGGVAYAYYYFQNS